MTHSRVGLACAVALLCVIGCAVPATAGAAEVIVRRDAGLSAAERADVRADAGVQLARKLIVPDTEVVTVPDARASEALDALNADPDVRYALPNSWLRVAAAPVDQMWRQWSLINDGAVYPGSVADSDIDAPDAWETGIEGQNVTVAVIDQQVYAGHADLNGRVEPGYDATEPDACMSGVPSGGLDHGTAVAGVVAADGRGRAGVAGVAPLAHVLPVRAIDNCGGGKLDWVLEAFEWAAGHAPIVSASFGSDPNQVNPNMNEAFREIFDDHPDTLFVVAAGNEGVDVDRDAPVYPCSTQRQPPAQREIGNLLCVGMTDYADRPMCTSNVGTASVDLFAPGFQILSTVRGGHFPFNGTSMATPMVAATAALVLSSEPTTGVPGLVERLTTEVDEKFALTDISVAHGRLNAAKAVGVHPDDSGGGDPSTKWKSCDRDHDGVRDDTGADLCPDQAGEQTLRGCPDADGDGVSDVADNCRSVANADQTDSDADRVGNACDQLPRGDDPDGDGVPSMDDRCPGQAGPAPDGCPVIITPPGPTPEPTATPTPTPNVTPQAVIMSLAYKLSKCPKGKKCTKVAKVTVKLSRQARVALKVERQVRKKGRLVWTRVGRQKSLTANTRGSTITVRGQRGKPAKYRVTATLAGKTKAVSFRV